MAWIKDAEGLGEETVCSLQVELGRLEKSRVLDGYGLGMAWVAPPAKKDAIVTSRIVLDFLEEGGGQPNLFRRSIGEAVS